ncbi:hypothetical protein ACRE_066800 [Hapsidospora chrysogenum ATCC 11550]|uniref:NAD(P)-binding domain-containing protein n=1 Tax=Hapsidospora chrysogenum (strain ATCC 11550 / CBS 779.69 / DSM 880 / IAM 14645 / JCM 23072 / IMI 49137) TaxID=857340 RepID=A0A086SZT1_HAPC1|nr:hypothetical protein ACRE_066800 [Hapsidospora chrysogenum ATCC 11550]
MPKTIAFLGASTGCGRAALMEALEAGHTCIALCRVPSKLDDIAAALYRGRLTVREGNAHDVAAVAGCLTTERDVGASMVDAVCSCIGSAMDAKTLSFEDPDVCRKGMETLLEALRIVRGKHEVRQADGTQQHSGPLVCALSTTGIASAGRDFPLLYKPLYEHLLGPPHADKKAMEALLVGSGERFVLVRPSLLTDEDAGDMARVRVGVEDARTGEVEGSGREIGYTISRAAVGRWVYGNVLAGEEGARFEGKAVSITW